jgi:F420H(2)-dependent quinone reductase
VEHQFVAPAHRFLYGVTGGRAFRFGKRNRSILLLTTTGRQTGRARTTPVFFLRDADRFVVCNVTPGSERTNPWVLNLRSNTI